MLKALLVDLDGTLADTIPYLYKAYCDFLAPHGVAGTHEEFQSLNGLTKGEVLQQLAATHSLQGHLDFHIDHDYPSCPVFPFARECLLYAKERGLKIAIVTSAKKSLVEAFTKRHKIDVDFVINGEEVQRGKPWPDIYLKALEVVNVRAEEALAIEDAPHGITAARGAGIPTLPFQDDWHEVFEHLKREKIAHPSFIFHPITADFKVVEQKRKPPVRQAEVDEIWEVKRKQNPRLFNGEIFRFLSFDGACLKGDFVSYKEYVAGLEPIVPVAVNGVIEAEGAILMGRRALHLHSSPGLWETVPAGTIDPEGLDIFKQIKVELFEETDLKEEEIVRLAPFAIVQDKIDQTWEICFSIEVKKRRAVSSPEGEYIELKWVRREDLLSFMEKERRAIIPFNRYLLASLL